MFSESKFLSSWHFPWEYQSHGMITTCNSLKSLAWIQSWLKMLHIFQYSWLMLRETTFVKPSVFDKPLVVNKSLGFLKNRDLSCKLLVAVMQFRAVILPRNHIPLRVWGLLSSYRWKVSISRKYIIEDMKPCDRIHVRVPSRCWSSTFKKLLRKMHIFVHILIISHDLIKAFDRFLCDF